jgi:predicted dehydrogenase
MNSISRRQFVKQTGAAGFMAGSFVRPGFVPEWARSSPNDTVNIAVMGIRSRGGALAEGFAKLPKVNVATICDIDENLLPKAVAEVEKACGKTAKTETDIRRVLDNKEIDAVVIAAPNHWHALATIWACQAGKDVYVEKPISWSISEGRRMVETARKHDRIVQVGTQNRSRPLIQSAVDYLQAGKLGKIYMIRCLLFRPRESIGHKPNGAIPKGVHYDLWTGPAAMRPFNENRFHYNWHWFWETGNGETGNNGPHYTDIARWILKKYEHPVRAQSMGAVDVHDTDQETPTTQISTLEYGDKTRVQIEVRNWYTNSEDGLRMGLLVFGSEGWMRLGSDDWATFFGRKDEPGPKMSEKEANARVDTLNTRGGGEEGHLANFIDCVRSRKRQDLKAELLEGHYSTAMCHLSNIAYRTGRQVIFDSTGETFTGDTEANSYLTRNYRPPFVVPTKV